jgi:hypothetical protein
LPAQIVLVGSLIVLSGFYITAGLRLVSNSHNNGLGFSSIIWHNSEILEQVNQLPEDMTIITNMPAAIYIRTGRSAVPLPRKMKAVTRQINQDYFSELASIEAQVADERGVIVHFKNNQNSQETRQIIAEIDQVLPLCTLNRANDGTIFGVAACH